MFAFPMKRQHRILALAMMLPCIVACSDGESTGPDVDALVGRWQVTSFGTAGFELIEAGFSMEITFTAVRTFTWVTRDEVYDSCEGQTCTVTGTYSATSTQITMTSAPEDVIFNYAIQGTTMTFTGTESGVPVTMVLRKM